MEPKTPREVFVFMIQATLRNVWLCVFCLSLLIVGCTSNSSSNGVGNQGSQVDALKEVVASDANSENELRARIKQISQTAQGRLGITVTALETGESVTLKGVVAQITHRCSVGALSKKNLFKDYSSNSCDQP